MILNLKVNLGNGYVHGIASNFQKSYKINIQEGSKIHMVVPEDLQISSNEGSIVFSTETGYDIPMQLSFKKVETDMILVYADIDTLMKLAKNLPIQMEIK